MAYESLKVTPVLDRTEEMSDRLLGITAHLIRGTRPGINQRRELLYDAMNDSRIDGTLIKALVKSY